jgi:hypothetical protein
MLWPTWVRNSFFPFFATRSGNTLVLTRAPKKIIIIQVRNLPIQRSMKWYARPMLTVMAKSTMKVCYFFDHMTLTKVDVWQHPWTEFVKVCINMLFLLLHPHVEHVFKDDAIKVIGYRSASVNYSYDSPISLSSMMVFEGRMIRLLWYISIYGREVLRTRSQKRNSH